MSMVELVGESKRRSFEEDTPFWRNLSLKAKDGDAHYPHVVYVFATKQAGNLRTRKATHQRSEEGRRKQQQVKKHKRAARRRAMKAVQKATRS